MAEKREKGTKTTELPEAPVAAPAKDRIFYLNAAGTPLVVLRSLDPFAWMELLLDQAASFGVAVYTWGPGRGFRRLAGPAIDGLPVGDASVETLAPLGAINAFTRLALPRERRLLLLAMNISREIQQNPATQQAVLDGIRVWKTVGKTLCVVEQPGFSFTDATLDRYTVYYTHALPTSEALHDIASRLVAQVRAAHPSKDLGTLDYRTGEVMQGLTGWQAEQVMAEGVLVHEAIPQIQDLIRAKEDVINNTPGLRLITEIPPMGNVIGLGRIKRFVMGTIRSPLARGVMLLGIPGTGKSMFAQAIASWVGWPMIEFAPGEVFGGLVGQSEKQVARALEVVQACRPCVLFVDELEKAFSGIQSSSKSDAGTTDRVAREFLMFLQNRPEGVYVIATANDLSKLEQNPEYLRAERWDALFFVDEPTLAERHQLLDLYKSIYKVQDSTLEATSLEHWTGAEIRTLCRTAAMLGIPLLEAQEYVIPIATTWHEQISSLRKWASGRCVPASDPELELSPDKQKDGKGRMVAFN
jgi:hypothetical protein